MATIVTKNSSTASAVPTTSDLVQGELAVNVTDKRIFTENASTQIVELGTNPSSITTATATVTGTLTANGTFASSNAVITGGSINSTPIGATTPSTIVGSTVTANTGFVGGLTGNVTGNLTGNVTGNVNGNLTGNVTGNVTASSGTTTLNDLVVNGTADFTNTKLTNITTPTVGTDAANKSYVDDTVAAVIDSAPAALDTLNELAAALGDDANFAGTVTTALATKLPLAGGTMTGAIAMGTSKITGLGDPTSAQDAATKTYVDTADALKLNLTGGTMSGAIAMGTNKITGVGDPTLAQDAATKAYTDSILGSATSAADSAAAASASASAASTSASNASNSADAAAASAAAAAASYDAFDDRYLGDKASDPTLDNDGNALLTGALYFNTTSDVMKVYDGSAWNIAAISSASPTFTGTVTADGLSLGDNDKATFGNSNDLQIYHDGSHSYIRDVGTGLMRLTAQDFLVEGSDGSDIIYGVQGGATTIYHSGATKLATTATGIDVTGTATMDGLTVDGNIALGNADNITFKDTGGTSRGILTFDANNDIVIGSAGAGVQDIKLKNNGATTRLNIDIGGDISFYEDTGTTPKFFWDASAERLGVGTSSPDVVLDVESSTASEIRALRTSGRSVHLYSDASNAIIAYGTGALRIGETTSTVSANFTERLHIDSSGELTTTNGRVNLITVGRGAGAVVYNTAVGVDALASNTSGVYNTATGYQSLLSNTTGDGNTANGFAPLYLNTTGNDNTAYGVVALYNNTTGSNNTAIGRSALQGNTEGANNTAVGYQAGYANTTGKLTAIGSSALNNNTTGVHNTAVGRNTLYGTTTGSYNLAVGDGGEGTYGALQSNSTGSYNIALGSQALAFNTEGNNNTAVGYQAGHSNTTGADNSALGLNSLYTNTTGNYNTAIGRSALQTNTTASNNTATGYQSLYSNTEGDNNTATGWKSLYSNTTGLTNTAVGLNALYSNTTGISNTAVGQQALNTNTTASYNTAVGIQAGFLNSTGTLSTFIGNAAGYNSTGDRVTAIGSNALQSLTTGTHNAALGQGSGFAITTGSKNTIIGGYSGNQGGLDIRTSNNNIVLSDGDGNPRQIIDSSGNVAIGTTTTNGKLSVVQATSNVITANIESSASTLAYCLDIYTSGATAGNGNFVRGFVSGATQTLNISNNGDITNTNNSYGAISDERLKENITDSTPKLTDLMKVQVRSYNLKSDPRLKQIGVIAQELEQVFPAMVEETNDHDAEGNDLGTTTKSVKYSVFVPMLIKAMQEQQAIIESLTNRIAALEGN